MDQTSIQSMKTLGTLSARVENKEWSAAEKIAAKLREKKMNQLLPVLKAAVLGQKGPLVEGEIERTKEYARTLASKLKESSARFFLPVSKIQSIQLVKIGS